MLEARGRPAPLLSMLYVLSCLFGNSWNSGGALSPSPARPAPGPVCRGGPGAERSAVRRPLPCALHQGVGLSGQPPTWAWPGCPVPPGWTIPPASDHAAERAPRTLQEARPIQPCSTVHGWWSFTRAQGPCVRCLGILVIPSCVHTLARVNSQSALFSHVESAAAPGSPGSPHLLVHPGSGDPTDSSPPGSTIPGIFQARTLEWVAISFSNA